MYLPRTFTSRETTHSQSSVTPLCCIFCQELSPPGAVFLPSFSSTPAAALPTPANVSTGALATISYAYSPQPRQSNGSESEVHTMKPKVLKALQQVQRIGSKPQKRAEVVSAMDTEERMELVTEHRQEGGVALQMVDSLLVYTPSLLKVTPFTLHCPTFSSLPQSLMCKSPPHLIKTAEPTNGFTPPPQSLALKSRLASNSASSVTAS